MRTALLPLLLLVTLLPCTALHGQSPYHWQARMKFAQTTHRTGAYHLSLEESRQLLALGPPDSATADTLHYVAARSAYALENPSEAMRQFAALRPSATGLGRWHHLAAGWEAVHAQDVSLIAAHTAPLRQGNDKLADYGTLFLLAGQLQATDTLAYRSGRDSVRVKDLYVRKALQQMDAHLAAYAKRPHKSPAVAGLLSTAVPGAGKCYLGRWGSGLVSLGSHVALGVQAWEGYRKGNGLRSPQFIAMGGLLLLSYGTNIYGSIIQTKAYNVQIVTDLRSGVGVEVDLAVDRLLR